MPELSDSELAAVDHVLTTTRAVRLRLDLDRDVPDDVILRCIDVAEQAPCGGSQPSRRWLVVRDPALKKELAGWYRSVIYPGLVAEFGLPVPGDPGFRFEAPPAGASQTERVFHSALHLAANLERVPALVICTIYGTHDQAGSPGLFDSVLQAAWSFCLAARARGLGTCWTSAHLGRAAEAAELLGVPAGVTQVCLLPVGYTTGGDFHAVSRPRAEDITFFDGWGLTRDAVTLEIDIEAPVAVVAALTSGRGGFTAVPKVYGGTRLSYRAPVDGQPVALRARMLGDLRAIKAAAEATR